MSRHTRRIRLALAAVGPAMAPATASYHDGLDASVAVIVAFLLATVALAAWALRMETRSRDRAPSADNRVSTPQIDE